VTIAAIPTTYGGQTYRSRLEARWAATFDLLDWQYEYEPVDLDGYIPDFMLLDPSRNGRVGPTLVEVKPAFTILEMRPAAAKIDAAGWEGDALILGATPQLTDTDPLLRPLESFGLSRKGISRFGGQRWEGATFFWCRTCRRPSFSVGGSLTCQLRSCGSVSEWRADNRKRLSLENIGFAERRLSAVFAKAGDLTRWQRSA
jgi:hypothetical protein